MTWVSSKSNPGWVIDPSSSVDPSSIIFNGATCGPLDKFDLLAPSFFIVDLGQNRYINAVKFTGVDYPLSSVSMEYSDTAGGPYTPTAGFNVSGNCTPDTLALYFSARFLYFGALLDTDVSSIEVDFYESPSGASVSTAPGGATMPRYTAPAEIVSGYFLNPRNGYFSVITPEARTNLVTNPSCETNATGYTSIDGATLARSTLHQQRGVYSLKVTPGIGAGSGVYFTTSLSANTVYSFSADVRGQAGVGYVLKITDVPGNIITQKKFVGRGEWTRVSCTGQTRGGGAHRLTLAKDGNASRMDIYTDGWQCEAGAYPTTYLDGDMTGFVRQRQDYRWTGTPHASTSTRSGMTRHGGRVVLLAALGFQLLSVIGLGMPPVEPVTIEFANLDGENFQDASILARPFTLVGQVNGASSLELKNRKLALISALRLDNVKPRQPLVLLYQYADACGNVSGDVLRLTCSYTGGMEGQFDNHHAEALALQFRMHLPLIMADNDHGQALSFSSAITGVSYTMRKSGGIWNNFNGGTNGDVYDIITSPQNEVIIGGAFGSIYSLPIQRLAKYTNDTVTNTGTATISGAVERVAVDVNGVYYVRISNTQIYKYSGTWILIYNSVTGLIKGLTLDASGRAMIYGTLGDIYYYDGAAWNAIGYPISDDILDVSVSNGIIYTGAAGGEIYSFDGSTWTLIGTANNDVWSVQIGNDGILYAGGEFTSIDGISASRIASWNGSTWSALGDGVNDTVKIIKNNQNGGITLVGEFTSCGPISSIPIGIAHYNGGVWTYEDIVPPTFTNIWDYHITPGGESFLAFDSSGSAVSSAVNTVTNNSDAPAAPRFILTGAGRLYSIRNYTTGDAIYFDLLLLDNEQLTLDLTPGNISFRSNLRGNLIGSILPGSNLTTFNLLPGANSVSVFIGGTSTSNTNAAMTWRETWHSIDGVR